MGPGVKGREGWPIGMRARERQRIVWAAVSLSLLLVAAVAATALFLLLLAGCARAAVPVSCRERRSTFPPGECPSPKETHPYQGLGEDRRVGYPCRALDWLPDEGCGR